MKYDKETRRDEDGETVLVLNRFLIPAKCGQADALHSK
jgi:hypothetical protein